ncbi:hypothetical protein [Nocardioides antri]|uniref:DUF4190 domain-containing protein n=1 Tax=Nocardioides antri TaxID=2607659 RepID=A0A5B1M8Z7_9ACTN|nr:hypothetical protein [Nocardioides antri]KAA1428407.1 hypothetical protein F0U47_05660 [Nocardioides antri]
MTHEPGLTPPSEPMAPAWGETAAEGPPVPPGSPAYGLPVAYQQVTGQQTHQGGLWAMILGILGLVSGILVLPTSGITLLGMICSPVALGLGLWSSKAISSRPDLYNNRGHAVAGWVLGLIGILLAVVMLLVAAAFVALFIWLFAGVEQ